MRLSYLVVALVAGMVSACGGAADPTTSPPKDEDPPSSFPSVAGTWAGTINYLRCEEPDGFGFCATLHLPKATAFQATMTQTSGTHTVGGLVVADVTGTMSFDGLSGKLTGVIDDIGSIFFDNDVFIAPMPPNHSVSLRNWIGQLYQSAWFGNLRMFVSSNGGPPGQAIVTANFTDVVRLDR